MAHADTLAAMDNSPEWPPECGDLYDDLYEAATEAVGEWATIVNGGNAFNKEEFAAFDKAMLALNDLLDKVSMP